MPHADPQVRAEYNRKRWQTHGHIYRAQRTANLPPISRHQVLAEDIAQAKELAKLEASRVGRVKAADHLKAFIQAEKRWIGVTATVYKIGGLDGGD